MWQVIASEEYQTLDLTWMAWVPWLPYLIAHVTVAWEVFFCVLVWNQRWRPLMLALGAAMHFGIGAFLGLWTFGLIMTYGYFAFGNPEWWRNRLTLGNGSGHSHTSNHSRRALTKRDEPAIEPAHSAPPPPAEP
jgi:hypothetical protein